MLSSTAVLSCSLAKSLSPSGTGCASGSPNAGRGRSRSLMDGLPVEKFRCLVLRVFAIRHRVEPDQQLGRQLGGDRAAVDFRPANPFLSEVDLFEEIGKLLVRFGHGAELPDTVSGK